MDRRMDSCSKPFAVLKNPCLKSTMQKLFEKRNTTGDIKFIIDSEEVRAHRCVLAALSPKYEAQFYGELAETDTITIRNVSAAAFKEFLQFFYTDDVTLTLENIEDVLNLAKQSLVDELVAECMNFLKNVIGLDKLLWCYQLASTYDMRSMEKYCVKQIGVNIKGVFETADFLSCERDMLSHILSFSALNCKEAEVFGACMAWARAKCERDGIDVTQRENLRAVLGDSIFLIRFCSMTNAEFATINREFSGLLSAQESIEVFQAIALKAMGVHSDTFGENNSMVRATIQPSLECAFAIGDRMPFDSTTGICFIDFSTDKAITLNGFILCNKIEDHIGVKHTVGLYGTSHRPKTIISRSENEMKILFDNPINIPASERCCIRIESKAFKPRHSGLHGYNLEGQTTQHGVSFDFIYCTAPNMITRLLFDFEDQD